MRPEDDETTNNTAGMGIVIAFLVIIWILRALFKAADQSK